MGSSPPLLLPASPNLPPPCLSLVVCRRGCRLSVSWPASMKQVKTTYSIPSLEEIYTFMRTLFKKAALSSECSIVCLIYVSWV